MSLRSAGARILLIDDEQAIARTIRRNLARHGFYVDLAATASDGLAAVARSRPDVVLLDLGLPDLDGLEVIRRVRSSSSVPIIVLSVRGGERDKVEALDLGADDFLTKPFGVDELLARIRVALRHAARPPSGSAPEFRAGGLVVDLEHRRVSVSGRQIHLSPTEYELLKAFVLHPNKVLTDRMLLQQVWGAQYGSEGHYLHVYMTRLRKKLEPDPKQPTYLFTETGVGYRLVAEEP